MRRVYAIALLFAILNINEHAHSQNYNYPVPPPYPSPTPGYRDWRLGPQQKIEIVESALPLPARRFKDLLEDLTDVCAAPPEPIQKRNRNPAATFDWKTTFSGYFDVTKSWNDWDIWIVEKRDEVETRDERQVFSFWGKLRYR